MQRRHLDRLQTTTRPGLPHRFFGDFYGELARVPAHIAEHPPPGGPFRAGSPVRYHLPAACLLAAAGAAAAAPRAGTRS